MEVHLHRVLDEDGETGFQAWVLSYLGFSTWAETESGVLEKIPGKLLDYCQFRQRFGISSGPDWVRSEFEVVARVSGNEILFDWDHQPATIPQIDETIALLHATRSDLLRLVSGMSEEILDWDPPYRRFSSWAAWRTVRQILVHIVNVETHYYLPNIGIHASISPAVEGGEWEQDLHKHREVTIEALDRLKRDQDLGRYDAEGRWSLRKVLRRLVWHERLHYKSIQRIIKAYQGKPA